jgi:hypothetical protein
MIRPDRFRRLMAEHVAALEERRMDAALTTHFGCVDWAALRAGTCLVEAITRSDSDCDGKCATDFDRRLKSLLEVSGASGYRTAEAPLGIEYFL